MKILKSIGAVVAGFLTVAVLSVLTDAILEHFGILPPIGAGIKTSTGLLALALSYRTLFTILGGYVTALLAPDRPMRHVYILAIIGFFAGVAGTIYGWNLSDHWYPIAIALTGPLFTIVGGKLKKI